MNDKIKLIYTFLDKYNKLEKVLLVIAGLVILIAVTWIGIAAIT